ncbi:MAG: peptide chain release factor 3, partial [Acidobacteria bacterium]|nr:peptide chain release factor 3 [Acidobacteriota bacterium]
GGFRFEGIPSFSPEHFVRVQVAEVERRKALAKGLEQLTQEGLVQLFTEPGAGTAAPILGAVGPLQFDVLVFRMQSEYKVALKLTPIRFKVARWPRGDWDRPLLRQSLSIKVLEDRERRPVLLFENQHMMRWIQDKYPELELAETGD